MSSGHFLLLFRNVDSATSSFKHSHTLLPVPQHPQQHQQQQSIFGELESYVLSQSQKSSSQVASYSPTSKLRQHHSQRIVTNQDPLTADDVTSLRSISPDFSSVASDSSSSSKRFWMFISPIATNFRALFERLSASDTLTLNRQLKRQFDVEKITNMSNVVIDNVMDDIESFSIEFTKSFLQVTAAAAATKGVTLNTPTAIIPQQLSNISTLSSTTTLLKVTEHENNVFLELVHLMHDILVDNGNLRTNINEIARAYYEVKEQAASKGGGSSTGGGGGAKKGGFFSSWSRSNSLESLPQ